MNPCTKTAYTQFVKAINFRHWFALKRCITKRTDERGKLVKENDTLPKKQEKYQQKANCTKQ